MSLQNDKISPVVSALTVWFSHFRWDEFSGAVGGGFAAGTWAAQQVHADADKQMWIGALVAIFAGGCYIRNPKTLEWIAKLPKAQVSSPPAPVAPAAIPPTSVPVPTMAPTIPVDPGTNPFGEGKGGDV